MFIVYVVFAVMLDTFQTIVSRKTLLKIVVIFLADNTAWDKNEGGEHKCLFIDGIICN